VALPGDVRRSRRPSGPTAALSAAREAAGIVTIGEGSRRDIESILPRAASKVVVPVLSTLVSSGGIGGWHRRPRAAGGGRIGFTWAGSIPAGTPGPAHRDGRSLPDLLAPDLVLAGAQNSYAQRGSQPIA
jgi:hypothetical protein